MTVQDCENFLKQAEEHDYEGLRDFGPHLRFLLELVRAKQASTEFEPPPFTLDELFNKALPILDSDASCDLTFEAIAFADWILEQCAPESKVRVGELVRDGL